MASKAELEKLRQQREAAKAAGKAMDKARDDRLKNRYKAQGDSAFRKG